MAAAGGDWEVPEKWEEGLTGPSGGPLAPNGRHATPVAGGRVQRLTPLRGDN